MSYKLLNKKFSEECVGLCEEGLQPISELFTTDRQSDGRTLTVLALLTSVFTDSCSI